MDIAKGESGIDVAVEEPPEKTGYKMVKIKTGMEPNEIDKLEEGVLYYYFFVHAGKKKWYSGYYNNSTKKIGSGYLKNKPYVIYYDRIPLPPSEENKSFNKLSNARTKRMTGIGKGTRRKRHIKRRKNTR